MKLRALASALRYFTILPVPAQNADATGPGPDEVAWLPLIGAFTGYTAGTIARLKAPFVGRDVASAFAFGWPILLTGALHYDGFLDTCDAAFASVSPERRLEIARDPRHGTFAVFGAMLQAAIVLPAMRRTPPARWPATLAAAEASARIATLAFAPSRDRDSDRARTERRTAARAFERAPAHRDLAIQGAVLVALTYRTLGKRAAGATLATGAYVALSAAFLRNRFKVLNGDAYGALIVIGTTGWLATGTKESLDEPNTPRNGN